MPFNNPHTYDGHSGVDFPVPKGTIFRASGHGQVKTKSKNPRGGYYIWVQYDTGALVGYHHMNSHNGCPNVGDWVNESSQLGFTGDLGERVTGPHLHSEVAGHATTAGYWQFFDPQRVVGGGTGSSMWSDTEKQQFLVSLGYDTGGVGNGWGPMSDAATRSFQSSVQLPSDGIFGPNTTSVAVEIKAGRKLDSVSRSVEEIQKRINAKVDGQWGNETSWKTYIAQLANDLDPDAIYGPATDSKLFITPTPAPGTPAFPLQPHQYFGPEQGGDDSISGWYSFNAELKQWQAQMIAKGFDLGPDGADGYYGPKGSNSTDTYTGRAAKTLQTTTGLSADGKIGPLTWAKAWTDIVPPVVKPDPTPPTADEASATPKLIEPTFEHFPSWIRYEEKFDAQFLSSSQWNLNLQNYYKTPYNPIEGHLHWWNLPGQGGSHDGNVDYLNRTPDVGANFVGSAGRITKTMPLAKIALTTGQRNPFAWKCECDPLITTSVSNHGYKTIGYLTYIIEHLNPSLRAEALRLHKEFYATSCSEIKVDMVRQYAEMFHTGKLDPATGEPPVVEPEPDVLVEVPRSQLEEWGHQIDELLSQ
jgi:peptidoglycan hydrolase-like protein with peptidoglycan-binding domain